MANKFFIYNTTDLIWLTFGLILIAVGVNNFNKWDKNFQDSLPESVATLKEVSNLVKVKNQNDLVWVKGDEGQDLSDDSLVYAGDFSRARIDFKNGSQVVMMPGSILRVYQDKKNKFKMKVEKGKAYKINLQGIKKPILSDEFIDPLVDQIEESPSEIQTVPTPATAATSPSTPTFEILGPNDLIFTDSKLTADFSWKKMGTMDENQIQKIVFEIQTPKGEKISKLASLNENSLKFKIHEIGTYQWIARFQDEVIEAGEFKVTQLYAPLIVGPKNRSLPESGELNLQWSYGQEGVGFEIETTSGDEIKTQITNSDLRTFKSSFNPKKDFKWRVRIRLENHIGPWSETAHLWPAPIKKETAPTLAQTSAPPIISYQLLIDQFLKPVYVTNHLPEEIVIRDLPRELASLIVFMGDEQIKSSGEEKLKIRIKKPGTYELNWFEIEGTDLRQVHQSSLRLELSALEDTIILPQDIVLETRGNDKK